MRMGSVPRCLGGEAPLCGSSLQDCGRCRLHERSRTDIFGRQRCLHHNVSPNELRECRGAMGLQFCIRNSYPPIHSSVRLFRSNVDVGNSLMTWAWRVEANIRSQVYQSELEWLRANMV